MDRWILSTLDRLTGEVVAAMDAYDLQQAVRPLVQFIDDLTNWYIRRSRRRFWKSSDDSDKMHAYETLHTVLLRLCQIAAPFTPFISEEIYRNLRTPGMPESVHLCDYPLPGALARDEALEAQMAQVQQAVAAIAAFNAAQISTLLDGGQIAIELDGKSILLDPADVLIQRTPKPGLAVASSGALVVALETALTPELVQEGHVRELINRIQNQRKTQELDVADRISLRIAADAELVAAIAVHRDTIAAETLAIQLESTPGTGDIDINGHPCAIEIARA